MKKLFYITTVLLCSAYGSMQAQVVSPDGIAYSDLQVKKEGSQVSLSTTANLNNMQLKSQNMVIITPVLQSADKAHSIKFDPFVITGKKRMKALDREMGFGAEPFEQTPTVIFRHKKNEAESIPMTLTVPYESWMRNASLIMQANTTGCASCDVASNITPLSSRILPPVVAPTYELSYVTPPAEPVKQRSETHSAYLNFEVGKSVLLHDFKNNAAELKEVNKIVSEVRNDKNLKFTEFNITGYASPEGGYEYNMKLSENRAKAFAAYMKDKEDMPASLMKVNWEGEDWIGLRQAVKASNLSNRDEILKVLEVSDINKRKAQLKALNGGKTYRMLLDDYYPALRRIDYTLAYIARPFDVNEAKQVIKTKPQYLSLNEMFLVANTYPKESAEFKEVFDIAVRLYPTDPVAQQNTAALEIERGADDAGIARLQKINTPEAWNNLGVAYAKKKEYQQALDYFGKAANAGVKAAAQNRDELSKWLDEQ